MKKLKYVQSGDFKLCAVQFRNPRERDGLLNYLHTVGYTWWTKHSLVDKAVKVDVPAVGWLIFEESDLPNKRITHADPDWYIVKDCPACQMTAKQFFGNYGKDIFAELFTVLDKLENKHEEG